MLNDILFNWRTAFGASGAGLMTAMRFVGTLWVTDQSVAPGSVTFGLITGSIGAQPAARPVGATTDDYTSWLLWYNFMIFNDPVVQQQVHKYDFDLRGMRKFDPSRETLWMITESKDGGTAFVTYGFSIRVLCGD